MRVCWGQPQAPASRVSAAPHCHAHWQRAWRGVKERGNKHTQFAHASLAQTVPSSKQRHVCKPHTTSLHLQCIQPSFTTTLLPTTHTHRRRPPPACQHRACLCEPPAVEHSEPHSLIKQVQVGRKAATSTDDGVLDAKRSMYLLFGGVG